MPRAMTQNGAEKDRSAWGSPASAWPGAVMVHAAAAHPGYVLKAAADPHPGPREAFARDHNARAYADVTELVRRSRGRGGLYRHPAPVSRAARELAAEHGKHIILEKPMALTLADCDAIIAAVERHKVHLVVGHTHAFDPAVRLMRDIIARGELGRLGLIHSFNYTNFLYRPRRPEELDTAQGGGILFNQVPHQIDTARLLAGGLGAQRAGAWRACSIRRGRPKASCAALLQFEGGAAASLVYSGYDHFDSDEWHFGIGERGAPKPIAHGAARRALAEATGRDASAHRDLRLWRAASALPPHQPHFGITIVTCANGDMRASADGVTIYGRDGVAKSRSRAAAACRAGARCWTTCASAIRSGRRPRARRPLGQGHGRGRARDPALSAGGPGGHAGTSGGGGRFAGIDIEKPQISRRPRVIRWSPTCPISPTKTATPTATAGSSSRTCRT